MRKISEEYENPIDNYFIGLAEDTAPFFYEKGFTPNAVTTLSCISTIIVVILLLQAKYYWAALFVLVSYYFDCLDGFMARKYNMVTVFGDYYDHISDFLKIFAVLATLYYINKEKFFKIIPIIILIFIMMCIHMGCQEIYYNTDESVTLNFTRKLCIVKNPNNMDSVLHTLKSTRYFGCGTFFVALALMVCYYKTD